MKIHEFQAKQVLAQYGVPVPRGRVAASPDLGDEPVVASEAQQAPGSQRPPGCVHVDMSGITHENAVGAPRFAHNSRTCVLVRR